MGEQEVLQGPQLAAVESQLHALLRKQAKHTLPVDLPRPDFWNVCSQLLQSIEMELAEISRVEGFSARAQTLSRRQANLRRAVADLTRHRLTAFVNHAALANLASTPFGDAALAAFATIRRMETTANMFSMGLGRSAGAVGAQNLGAGQSSRTISAFRWAILFGILPSAFIALVFFIFSEQVSLFVASDPEFVDLASNWLSVLALGYVSISVVLIFTHAFNAAGQTLTPMFITLSTIWLFEIPLALVLANTSMLGQFGVPWAIVIGNTLRLVVFTWYFFRGEWSRTGIR